ncbi:MAG: hypothetical protein V1721_02085 [Pseudomonadota bacterium]
MPQIIPPVFFSKALTLVTLTVCPVKDAPRVEVLFGADKSFYTEQHSSATLKESLQQDKESTLTTEKGSTVFGVATSLTTGLFHVSFNTLTDQSGNQCLYIDKATLAITYSPAVFVSSDILDLACTYQTTQEHEWQHISIDLAAMQEYIPHIKMDMLLYLRDLGYQGFGPYRQYETPKHVKELTHQLDKASEPMVENLREVRRERQRSIDTLENYKRESEKCPQDASQIHNRFYGKRSKSDKR